MGGWILLAMLVGACGRIGFQFPTDGGNVVDAATDADIRETDAGPRPVDAGADARTPDGGTSSICGTATTAPDPLTISGATFNYTNYMGDTAPLAGVTVDVFAEGTSDSLGRATSAPDGRYVVSIPTGGVSRALQITYQRVGWFTTVVHSGLSVDGNATATYAGGLLRLGDGVVWPGSGIDSIYASVGEVRDAAKATLVVMVTDCAGELGIAGAKVLLSRPADLVAYPATDGTSGATATVLPLAQAVGYNVEPGVLTITATATGRTFSSQTITLEGGEVNTLVTLHALD